MKENGKKVIFLRHMIEHGNKCNRGNLPAQTKQ